MHRSNHKALLTMETFRTQFEMKNVLTQVTVEELEENTYGCIMNLVDFFDGGELPVAPHDYDIIIKRLAPDKWEAVGEPKIKFDDEDIQNLGIAIEVDKTA
jgi:hypothetical protein